MKITNPTPQNRPKSAPKPRKTKPAISSFSELSKYKIRTENLGFVTKVLTKGGVLEALAAFAFAKKAPGIFLGLFTFGAISVQAGVCCRRIHLNMLSVLETAKKNLTK